MDWLAGKEQVVMFAKKYRYVFVIAFLGIFLMAIPEPDKAVESEISEISASEPDLQESLEEILSKVYGAGSVEVLLTQAEGPYTVYQTNDDLSLEEEHRDTVIVTDSNREETGLIVQMNPPVYMGAVVLCQGADQAGVRLAIVEAVKSVTGLTSDHITVLKMK